MVIHPSTLTPNDRTVLSALFDPETLPSNISKSTKAQIDPSLPSLPTISSASLSTLESQQKALIANLQSATPPTLAELKSILSELDTIIEDHPDYPSAYLNRAQVGRLVLEAQAGSEGTSNSEASSTSGGTFDFSKGGKQVLERVFEDLRRAIQICTPAEDKTPVSEFRARILRNAYSHRAYLYLKASETLYPAPTPSSTPSIGSLSGTGEVEKEVRDDALPKQFQGLDKSGLEDMASRDFKQAAWFGDDVAREMSVRTNPYAKMCGMIVRNALREEREGKV